MMAWLAWKESKPSEVVARAHDALRLWEATVVSYRFKWLCLWPLMAVRLALGQIHEAVETGRELLTPPQLRFPDALESLLESAVARWGRRRPCASGEQACRALELADRLEYA
jgi:hypothetical protein